MDQQARADEVAQAERAAERTYMMMAIREAERSRPEDDRVHPRVGVVVVKDGQVLGKGHRRDGKHAEYLALEENLADERLADATVYTTLEPCTERTPPKVACVDRLIERRVKRVVVGMLDPNPTVRGLGIRQLERVRIQVDRFDEDLRLQIEEMNRDFIREHEAHRHRSSKDSSAQTATASTEGPTASGAQGLTNDDIDERQAVRAFLQRAEVRLSTMHRVAGAFLSGAGLLFLLPVLFRDYPPLMITVAMSRKLLQENHPIAPGILFLIPLVAMLALPVYSLYLLVKDIVLFYFIGQCPGFADDDFYPRFALTAIAFSPDESERIKEEIIKEQRQADLMAFAVPRSQAIQSFDHSVWDKMGPSLYPPTRKSTETDTNMHRRFRVLLGQAGLVDRGIVSEAARVEVSLVRHNIHLRRLVLRYAKALLLMIWTIVVMFGATVLAAIDFAAGFTHWRWTCLALALAAWFGFTPRIVKWPIAWIYEWANQNASKTKHVANDPELTAFENTVHKVCVGGWWSLLAASVAAIILSALA